MHFEFVRNICSPVVKVVLKGGGALPIHNPECHSHPGHPSETSPLLVYSEHEKPVSVDSGVDCLLCITINSFNARRRDLTGYTPDVLTK